ncbi:MAG: type VI secretion system Vgr family protein [Planctomycetes bacterium]|nr:type VI secretion system Vgr family protein [Planctomycetota bacterium]
MLTVIARIGRHGQAPLQPQVLGLDGEDRLSAGFLWQLDCASASAVPSAEVLGQGALVTISAAAGGPAARVVSAQVTGWDDLGTVEVPGRGRLNAYRARLEPAFARLDHDLADGVHRGRSAIQVATDLLAGRDHAGAAADPALGVAFYDGFLSAKRPARQQILRWRESTAATVRRLLEDEGVFTYHVHQADGGSDGLGVHTLVLSERNRNQAPDQPVAGEDQAAQDRRRNAANPVVAGVVRERNDASAAGRRLWRWQTIDRDGAAKVAVADRDYRNWSANPKVDAEGARALDLAPVGSPSATATLVRREFPAGLAGVADDSEYAPDASDATCASVLADRRAGELLCRRRRLRGEGDHIGLQAGTVMSFAGSPQDSYLVVGARLTIRPVLAAAVNGPVAEHLRPLHDAIAGMALAAAEVRWSRPAFDLLAEPPQTPGATLSWQGLGLEARCAVEALPIAIPFVPERLQPPPALAGIHLATVVAEGSSTAAIATDELARVKVAFPWDAAHPTGWVRVVQPQAGDGGGMLIIPRVGDEVAVAFTWGRSDQPVVMGGLFTHLNKPPHDPSELPARTVLRSRGLNTDGSKDPSDERHEALPAATRIAKVGEEFALVEDSTAKPELAERKCNELALDDTAGAERADLFAARDLHLQAAHDGILRAGRSLVIDAGESLTIRVGNTMLKMEHGELMLGVYNPYAPGASSAISCSLLDLKASAPSMALTGLIGATMASAASSVSAELAGATMAGVSAEMKTGLLSAGTSVVKSAFSTFSGYKASNAQGITSEYAAHLPAGEVAALTEEMLMSSADVAGVAVKFARDPEALLGSAKIECLGGRAELTSTPTTDMSLLRTFGVGFFSAIAAGGSALARNPDDGSSTTGSDVMTGVKTAFQLAGKVIDIAWPLDMVKMGLYATGRLHEQGIQRHEEHVDHDQTALNHDQTEVNHDHTAVEHQESSVAHTEDAVEHESSSVSDDDATVTHESAAMQSEDASLESSEQGLSQETEVLDCSLAAAMYAGEYGFGCFD